LGQFTFPSAARAEQLENAQKSPAKNAQMWRILPGIRVIIAFSLPGRVISVGPYGVDIPAFCMRGLFSQSLFYAIVYRSSRK
jgi:hypothetical protein